MLYEVITLRLNLYGTEEDIEINTTLIGASREYWKNVYSDYDLVDAKSSESGSFSGRGAGVVMIDDGADAYAKYVRARLNNKIGNAMDDAYFEA